MTAKKTIGSQVLKHQIKGLLHYSQNINKRNFCETVEIHIGLKNFDPARDKRISGNVQLPHKPRKQFRCLVLGNEKHIMQAQELGLDSRCLDDLKKLNRDKKQVKALWKPYDKILASATIIRQIPRLLGPSLSRMGKFPLAVRVNENIGDKIKGYENNVKFALKFKMNAPMCLSGPIGYVEMNEKKLEENIIVAVNFILTLMKKGWQNIKKIHIKSSMGPVFTIYDATWKLH